MPALELWAQALVLVGGSGSSHFRGVGVGGLGAVVMGYRLGSWVGCACRVALPTLRRCTEI